MEIYASAAHVDLTLYDTLSYINIWLVLITHIYFKLIILPTGVAILCFLRSSLKKNTTPTDYHHSFHSTVDTIQQESVYTALNSMKTKNIQTKTIIGYGLLNVEMLKVKLKAETSACVIFALGLGNLGLRW